jgi:hypothetical protein
MPLISKALLEKMYVKERKSMKAISVKLRCSVHKVQYWLAAYEIPRRSISDAIYQWHNPKGDPFRFDPPRTIEDQILFGIGIGLYWGEGTKANRTSVRLGNTDPALLEIFLKFLVRFFGVQKGDFRFGLQLFTDIDQKEALDFWSKRLKIHRRQFFKVTITPSGSIGTYRRKSRYGVLTIYYSNYKLRDALVELLKQNGYISGKMTSQAAVAQLVEQHNGNV